MIGEPRRRPERSGPYVHPDRKRGSIPTYYIYKTEPPVHKDPPINERNHEQK